MEKHERAYLLKERERRRTRKEQKKAQPTKGEPTAKMEGVQEGGTHNQMRETAANNRDTNQTGSDRPSTRNKAKHESTIRTNKPETNNTNTIRKEKTNTEKPDRNCSLRWTTTRTNSKNAGTRKEEQTGTLQKRSNAPAKRSSSRKRKLEDELGGQQQARGPPQEQARLV